MNIMKSLLALLISVYVVTWQGTLFAQEGSAQEAALPDSMLSVDRAYALQYTNRQLAERILNEMRSRRLASDYQLDRTEASILYNNMEFGRAQVIYEQMLGSREVKADDDKTMDILESLCNTHDALHQTREMMDCVNCLLDMAQRNENKYYHSVALFLLGKTIFYEGKKERGISNVRQAIDLMEQSDHPRRDHLLHSQLNVLATMLIGEKQFDEALQSMERNERILRSQNPINTNSLMTILAKKANLLVRVGRTAEADSVYDVWKTIPKNLSHPRAYFIIDYLRNRGLYEEAMKVYVQRLGQLRQTGDTVNMMVYIMKWGMAETAYGLHRYQEAADLYLDVLNIGDTLRQQAAESKAQEIEAIYRTHAKEQQIVHQRLRITVLTAIVILLAIALSFWGWYSWTVRRKNRAMVKTIQELMTYRNLAHGMESAEPPHEDRDVIRPEDNDQAVFLEIDGKVVRDRLFRSPDFDRSQLVRVSGLDKNRLASVIRQYAGTNIRGYINAKRVEYAVELMRQYPDYTLVAIADLCGFTSQTTFIRAFKNTFGMTPSDYRNARDYPPQ